MLHACDDISSYACRDALALQAKLAAKAAKGGDGGAQNGKK